MCAALLIAAITLGTAGDQAHTIPSDPPGVAASDPDSAEGYSAKGGWGPPRPTFTIDYPSTFITLNSIVDNPTAGDERNFFSVMSLESPNSKFADNVSIKPGHRYRAALFFSMDAMPSLNLVSENTRVQFALPSTIKGSGRLNGFVSASNAAPRRIWDSAVLTLPSRDDAVALRYMPDSARIYSQGSVNGHQLDVLALTSEEGALVGCDALDGRLDGSSRCEGWVTVDFIAVQADFVIDTWLSHANQVERVKDANLKPSDRIVVTARYENTGSVRQDNVRLIIGSLPRCVQLKETSAAMSNSNSQNAWTPLPEPVEFDKSINMGDYLPGGTVYLKFELELCDSETLSDEYAHDFGEDGALWLVPDIIIRADTADGSKSGGPLLLTVLGPNQK
ncbi:hypothetical protein [Mycobacterium adipatum]|uniref:hypothetical protein n=1 Tax=Mycobacterium adipatum TaxID=1682113 RepID=UPI000A488A12|nr:hypothetical protein [Mycobacterium adipatum]